MDQDARWNPAPRVAARFRSRHLHISQPELLGRIRTASAFQHFALHDSEFYVRLLVAADRPTKGTRPAADRRAKSPRTPAPQKSENYFVLSPVVFATPEHRAAAQTN